MEISPEVFGFSFIILGILLVIGKWIRVFTPFLKNYFIPTSIIAGLFGLVLGPEILGLSGFHLFDDGGLFPSAMLDVWGELPGLLINVIFASLFLGITFPSIKEIWKLSGPQITFSHFISWGQYMVGIILTLVLLTPVFGLNPAAGALLEISFVGGHGTAAGLSGTFEALGFEEGTDLAIGLATISLLTGVFLGVLFINWAARKGKTEIIQDPSDISEEQKQVLMAKEEQQEEPAGKQTTRSEFLETLTVHFGYIGLAIAIGYIILQGLILLEEQFWAETVEVFAHLPLFPLAMVGAVIVQSFLNKFVKYNVVDRGVINRIQGLALDMLITAALTTLSLAVIANYFLPFLIMAAAGTAWSIFSFLVIAPRMMPDYWFERTIGDFGQAMGLSAAGLLLIQLADPENESPAKEGFSYKQLFLDLFVGGGIVTAASVPIIIAFGPGPALIAAVFITAGWLLLGLLHFGKQ